jgi:CoA:oxalate CoA-transferase
MGDESLGPLEGVVVVDLSRQLAGPQCTRILADLGARVIKIEQVGSSGDMMAGTPFFFHWVSHTKERCDLDLRDPQGKQMLDELLASADVLVENFKPGVMESMGYDWESVHARWPRLVMCSVSGFGQTGPYRSRPAMDVVIQAMSGVMSMTGYADKPPTGAGAAIADIGAGMYGAIGVLSALLGRAKSNQGAYVDVAMLDCMAAIMGPLLARTLNDAPGYEGDSQPGRMGSSSRSGAPFDIYACKDGWVAGWVGGWVGGSRLTRSRSHAERNLCLSQLRKAAVLQLRRKPAC